MGKLSENAANSHDVLKGEVGAKLWLNETQLRTLRRIAAENHVTPDDLISLAVEALVSHIRHEPRTKE